MNPAEEIWAPTMFNIWGYAILGDGEPTVDVAENGGSMFKPMWDDPRVLVTTRINGHRPKDWYACYWVGEHVRRGHALLLE